MLAWPPAYRLYIPYRCTYCLYISNVSKLTVAGLSGANFSTNVTAQKSASACLITCIHIATLGLGQIPWITACSKSLSKSPLRYFDEQVLSG